MGLAAPLVFLAFAAFLAFSVLCMVFGIAYGVFGIFVQHKESRPYILGFFAAIAVIFVIVYAAIQRHRIAEEEDRIASQERWSEVNAELSTGAPSERLPLNDDWVGWSGYLRAVQRTISKDKKQLGYIFIFKSESRCRYLSRTQDSVGSLGECFQKIAGAGIRDGEVLVVGSPDAGYGARVLSLWFESMAAGSASGGHVIYATRGTWNVPYSLELTARRTGATLEYFDAGSLPTNEKN